ncbi:hypothetical protein E4P24_16250 [Haloferax sp. AS1]|uniref:sulfatase-like hydrolase/transferase n=1 Tax=Haloferax sp. AS1 TaxID=2562277 RepID=UPI0019B5D13E|nr:hypothetical protein [Haloferax sp. AS1]
MNAIQWIKKRLRSPKKVPSYLYMSDQSLTQISRLEAHRRRNTIECQMPLIHNFIDHEEFVLVILDACRYDVFSEIYEDYLTGELDRVWASGRWTAQYCERTWTKSYDLTYISSIPVFSDFYFDLRNKKFRPGNHIQNIVHMWDHEWDPSLGTTPPEEVTDEALRHANAERPTRIVVHYAQPHVPYIGDETIEAWSSDEVPSYEGVDDIQDLLRLDKKRPTQVVLDKIRSGEVIDKELERAYRSNLHYVMEEVVRIVYRVDCPVVVTADHGEHLGEKGYYLHEEDSTIVRKIPWLSVNDDEIGILNNKKSPSDRHSTKESLDVSNKELEEQLKHLGYM